MPSIFTLTGSDDVPVKKKTKRLGAGTNCVCKTNPRTGRKIQVCRFEKGDVLPSGKTVKKRGMKITGTCP
jgi:hypothetical protein